MIDRPPTLVLLENPNLYPFKHVFKPLILYLKYAKIALPIVCFTEYIHFSRVVIYRL